MMDDDPDGLIEIFDRIAKSKRRSLPILRSGAPDDCRKCGACCEHFQEIDVHSDDPNYDWLRDRGYLDVEYSNSARPETAMKNPDNRCKALAGDIGGPGQCSIYEHRPIVCRKFEMGSAQCRSIVILDIFKCYGDGRRIE